MTSSKSTEGNKSALIFGVSGQAGSYLAELLLSKGYHVTGTVRGHSEPAYLDPLWATDRFGMMTGVDFGDPESFDDHLLKFLLVDSVYGAERYHEIYNMAADMYAPASWDHPSRTLTVNGTAAWAILDAIKKYSPESRFFQAGSAEIYRPLNRWSPYATSKVVALDAVKAYRAIHGIHASCGIFYNMESARRPGSFFAKKVCQAVAVGAKMLSEGKPFPRLELGPLGAVRDWGLCREYVEGAWMTLNREPANDFVFGTGKAESCFAFVLKAISAAGLPTNVDLTTYFDFLPSPQIEDVHVAEKGKVEFTKERLGWEARTKFPEVVSELVKEEMEALAKNTPPR